MDNAAEAIVANSRGALLAKVDIAAAYRNIPVHPDDRWLLSMKWEDNVFIDTALPFGLRSAPIIFTAVADAAEWILRQHGVHWVMHYLIDFLLIGVPSSQECEAALYTLCQLFHYLGLPIAPEKVAGPSTLLDFLCLDLDMLAMELRLSYEKLSDLHVLIWSWLLKRSCRKRELESLIGSLSHACKIVQCGKTFLRRLFELLSVGRITTST